ncbi:4-hydroxy-3-methylbut-2-enyl diphosphate reductase [Candidatus Photodesmus anomalopis]|uniref:4-hydroxy-3-methylbut-2-enyl diphosphate reductase n=1 Tax=Candidatus Photodesmus katoptron Akat1 TaxID=1236703 RepID=S3DZH0_9GAMM|nr:4-hydroxy-3-methylbut-2-enyl diphosphate reductase [Candidatus Photodesmus katoptron]EPE37306.1 4-hydroxy-3-methylbut-2-enyl diphosphate reductase [Candidatus Photodesmus katoptron Akat1]
MKIVLANPRGFCAGVERAVNIVKCALEIYQAPVYVRHEIVHNRFVVDDLKQRGAIFVEELNEVPNNSIVVFSAHGVSKTVRKKAKEQSLTVFDATCPLVKKVHMEVARASRKHMEIVLIGHSGHPEVQGTMGHYTSHIGGIYLIEVLSDIKKFLKSKIKDPNNLCYVTQTTLSVNETKEIINELNRIFPNIQGPKKDDICYATQNRQDAVHKLASYTDLVIVVGSNNSSNSTRLKEIAENLGIPSYLVDCPENIKLEWLKGKLKVGVTAGASAPQELVDQIVERIKISGEFVTEQLSGCKETVFFELPKELEPR